MIGFKKIPKKTVLSVFIVAVLSILLVYVDIQYNDPLPIEEVKFSKDLKKKPGPIKNKLIHVVQKGDSLSVIFDEKEIPLNTAYKIFNSDKNNLLTSIRPDDVMEFSYLGFQSMDVSRVGIWNSALTNISYSPLFGYGGGSFSAIYESQSSFWKGHAHNLPLELAFSYGIPAALIIFVPIFVLLIIRH